MKRRITIKDIAQHLLLSVSTVSRALVDDKNIRKETKERVLQAAKELGYSPNPVATNLKYGRTNSIGVIVPEMITPYASNIIEGIQSVLYPLGYRVMIANSNESPQRELDNLTFMEQFMVDGIIVCTCDYNSNNEKYQQLHDLEMPLVFYDRIPRNKNMPQVLIDDYKYAFFMTEHLIRLGRSKIGYMRGPKSIYNSHERERGYRDAMKKSKINIENDMIVEGGVTINDGSIAVEKLTHCDAIFAFTDTIAIGAMNQLITMGYRIPEDIAIAGFSGTELSTIVNPQLTTVVSPMFDIGVMSARLMIERIKKPDSIPRVEVLDASIEIRGSVIK